MRAACAWSSALRTSAGFSASRARCPNCRASRPQPLTDRSIRYCFRSPRWNPNPDVCTGRHVVQDLHFHLGFDTKYRRNAFTEAMLTHTEEVVREVCTDLEAELKQFDAKQDHVHLLVHYPPKVQLSKLVNSLKAQEYDAHVRRYLWSGHFWSGSYFAGDTADRRHAVHREPATPRPVRKTVRPHAPAQVRAAQGWPSPPPQTAEHWPRSKVDVGPQHPLRRTRRVTNLRTTRSGAAVGPGTRR
ncbi:IS200/IS605 family transposase [Streptomyces umbrinus]